MATKTANVTARVSPEIKNQAEAVLNQLGIPVSVLIDSLYRQTNKQAQRIFEAIFLNR